MSLATDWIETRMAYSPVASAPAEDAQAVDWHDLHLNGMPAVHRAIAWLERALARIEAAQRAELAELSDRVSELEYLWSEEIIRQILPAATPVQEDNHGSE